jgi:SAM-dependent methyltransferase
MEMSKEVEAGQAIYTPLAVSLLYDPIVLRFNNPVLWKCPTSRMLQQYNELISANHLDVGVGSGYYMANCSFPSPTPRLGLMDLNPNSLAQVSRRAGRYKPECYRHNVLEPISFEMPKKFDTIGMNFLLHCVPGAIEKKAVAFDHLRPLLNPGGRIFGSTIVQGNAPRSPLAQWFMDFYNRKGVFHNAQDTEEGLRSALKERFSESSVTVVGCVALFQARA